MRKYFASARPPGGPAAPRYGVTSVDQSQVDKRQVSIAESLIAAFGVTMARQYSLRQGWDDVLRCIDMARCNPQDT
jgi:hypothetical protein